MFQITSTKTGAAVPHSSITSHFALMTDISRVMPAPQDHPTSKLPGVLIDFDRDIKQVTDSGLHGALLMGSSPTPLAILTLMLDRHAFYLVANPLDAVLRPLMEKQRAAEMVPTLLVLPNEKFVRSVPAIRAWDTALVDTEGREFGSPTEWLEIAELFAPMLPGILGTNSPDIRRSKWHHVYFVVPDDAAHPLYSKVS
jgi:hypothetical protein